MIKRIIMKLKGELDVNRLKEQGLEIGENYWIGRNCFFDPSHCFLITIGNDVTFSSNVRLLAHDASTKKHLGFAKIGRIDIKDHVFIGANATVLPGVTIGEGAIVGACALVTKDIEPYTVYTGVPAKKMCTVDEYIHKFQPIKEQLCFGEEYTFRGGITAEMKKEMKEKLANGVIGFVE